MRLGTRDVSERLSVRVGDRLGARLVDALRAPVDSASLAFFRIAIGAISAWEVWRVYDGNQIKADFELPPFHFRWWLFDWVRPLPGAWLYVAFAVTGVAAVFVALGLFYRAAAVVHWLGLSYWILLDKATYLNHRYLTMLFAFLLIFLPADAAFSLDARRKRWVRSRTVPSWTVWLLRFQVGVPHFFAGIAKLDYDWLVRAEPLRTWLADQTDFPVLGHYFTNSAAVHVMAVGSAVLDLAVPLLLLSRRFRAPTYAGALAFHFVNARVFEIGIFPWMMMLATTIFFDPDWPRRVVAAVRSKQRYVSVAIQAGVVVGALLAVVLPRSFAIVQVATGAIAGGVLAYYLVPARFREGSTLPAHAVDGSPWRRFALSRRVTVALIVWLGIQLLLPVRHFVMSGNVHWTEEGSRFAWQMLLDRKRGSATFYVMDPATGRTGTVAPGAQLSRYQFGKMIESPDMIVQYAQYLERYLRESGIADDVEIRAVTSVSLNERRHQPIVDPDVDLTTIRRPYLPPAHWIVPLRPYS